MINLAIFSPNQNAYSETFITAHKSLPFNNKFYYGGILPTQLEGKGALQNNVIYKLLNRIKSKVSKTFTPAEIALRDSLSKQKVDVVLAEYGTTAAESLNVLKSLKLPLIAHFHGFDASEYEVLNSYRKQYSELFAYAKVIVVVSEKMKKALFDLGCPQEKLLLNTCGPNSSFLNIKPSFKKKQFIAIGRFVDKKAPYLLLSAFKLTLAKHPNTTLIFGGTGPLINTCQNLATIWGISENVKFKGVMSPEQIKIDFSESIAFVQHSITAANGDSEGTPVAIIEAQAAGLPVISTYHAGIPDVVLHEQTGLLCNELDVELMANHMIKLLDDTSLCQTYGKQAKERIREHFTMEKHLGLLEDVVSKSAGQ